MLPGLEEERTAPPRLPPQGPDFLFTSKRSGKLGAGLPLTTAPQAGCPPQYCQAEFYHLPNEAKTAKPLSLLLSRIRPSDLWCPEQCPKVSPHWVHLPLVPCNIAKGPCPIPPQICTHPPTPSPHPLHTYTIPQPQECVVCRLPCATQTHLRWNTRVGLPCSTFQEAALCTPTRTQTYVLHHRTYTKIHTQTHREASAECTHTPVYMSVLGHKHMLMYMQVSPGPAQPQSYSGPGVGPTRSEMTSSQQAPGTVSQA